MFIAAATSKNVKKNSTSTSTKKSNTNKNKNNSNNLNFSVDIMDKKIFQVGCGGVGSSMPALYVRHFKFSPGNITICDKDKSRVDARITIRIS